MDNGSIHAVGTFNELLKTNKMFKKMIELQKCNNINLSILD